MVNVTRLTSNTENRRLPENQLKLEPEIVKKSSKIVMKGVDMSETKMTQRHTFAFWTIVWLIFVLAVGNLILTITIFGVLKLGRGMAFLELVPEANIVKFFDSIDMDRVYKKDGKIEGFLDIPIEISSDKAPLMMNMIKPNGHLHNRLTMSKNGTQFNNVNQFDLHDPATGEILFTTHKPTFNIESGAENLIGKVVSASRVTASIADDLTFNQTNHNKSKISIRGSEGVLLNSKEILLDGENIHMKTHNGSIYFTNNHGIVLDVKRIPVVQEKSGLRMEEKQYKICVCMPEGRLFRVPISQKHNNQRDVCNLANLKFDPCA